MKIIFDTASHSSINMNITKMLVDKWIWESNLEDNYSIQNEGRGAYSIRARANSVTDLQEEGCDSYENIEPGEVVGGNVIYDFH